MAEQNSLLSQLKELETRQAQQPDAKVWLVVRRVFDLQAIDLFNEALPPWLPLFQPRDRPPLPVGHYVLGSGFLPNVPSLAQLVYPMEGEALASEFHTLMEHAGASVASKLGLEDNPALAWVCELFTTMRDGWRPLDKNTWTCDPIAFTGQRLRCIADEHQSGAGDQDGWSSLLTRQQIASKFGNVGLRTVTRWAKGETRGPVEVRKQGSMFKWRPWHSG